MTHDEIYNYENLKEDDKKLIDMYDFAIQDASNKEFIIDDCMELVNDNSTLGKLKREIAEEALNHVIWYMQSQRDDLILSWIDSYEDDYFDSKEGDEEKI